jgi:hypothetical protein
MREMGAAPLKNTGKKMRKIRKFATLAKARIPDIDCIFGVLSAMEALPDFDDTLQARNCIGLLSLVWMEHQPHSRQPHVYCEKPSHDKEGTAYDSKGGCQKTTMRKRGRSVNQPKPNRSNGGSSTGSAG